MGVFTSVVKCKGVRIYISLQFIGYFLVTLGIQYLERHNFIVKKLVEKITETKRKDRLKSVKRSKFFNQG